MTGREAGIGSRKLALVWCGNRRTAVPPSRPARCSMRQACLTLELFVSQRFQ